MGFNKPNINLAAENTLFGMQLKFIAGGGEVGLGKKGI